MTSTVPDTEELAGRLRLAVTRLARLLRQQVDAGGLTPSMTAALATAERFGSATIGELAAAEQVATPSMSVILARLEEVGLVTKDVDPADRRVTRVRVTPAGRATLARLGSRKDAVLERRLHGLDADDLAVLQAATEMLERLSAGEEP